MLGKHYGKFYDVEKIRRRQLLLIVVFGGISRHNSYVGTAIICQNKYFFRKPINLCFCLCQTISHFIRLTLQSFFRTNLYKITHIL